MVDTAGADRIIKEIDTAHANGILETEGADTDRVIEETDTAHTNGVLEKTGTDTDRVTKKTDTVHANRTVKETDNDSTRTIEGLAEEIRKLRMIRNDEQMDTSHINRIGKKIDKAERCPCCSPKGDEDYEVYPSSIQVERQLISQIPFYESPKICNSYGFHHNGRPATYGQCKDPLLSSKQHEAVHVFQLLRRQFLQDAHSLRPFLDDLKQIGVIVDNFFFDGKLMERLSIHWQSRADALAYFQSGWACNEHLQSHTGRLCFHCHVLWDGEITPAFRLEYFFVEMLHELCHAWIEFFTSRQTFSYDETIKELGFRGHGTWFQKLMFKCLGEGSGYFKFEHLHRHLKQHVGMCAHWEQDNIEVFDKLIDWIQKEEPDPQEIERRMRKMESVSEEMIRGFHEVRAKGANVDEAIYLMGVVPARRFLKATSPSAQRFYILPDSAPQKRKRDLMAQHGQRYMNMKRRRGNGPTQSQPPDRKRPCCALLPGQEFSKDASIFSMETIARPIFSEAAKKPAGQRSLSNRVASLLDLRSVAVRQLSARLNLLTRGADYYGRRRSI